VAKYDILEHRARNSEQLRNLLLNLGAMMVYFEQLSFLVLRLQGLLYRLELANISRQAEHRPLFRQNRTAIEGLELQPRVSDDFRIARHSRLYDEITALVAVGRQRASRDVFEHLYDGLSKPKITVFPEPFFPQISVSGVSNSIFYNAAGL
jgi:hypothetical protein